MENATHGELELVSGVDVISIKSGVKGRSTQRIIRVNMEGGIKRHDDPADDEEEKAKDKHAEEAHDESDNMHMLEASAVAKSLGTRILQGLASKDAAHRLSGGRNVITPKKQWSQPMKLIFKLFQGFGPIMWVAAILLFISYEPLGGSAPSVLNLGLAVVVLVVILTQGLFSWYQEFQASNVLAAFSNTMPAKCFVRRDGHSTELDAADLVIGDVVILQQGMSVPADIRVVEAHGLRANTSALTGEAEPIRITTTPVNSRLIEASNCVFLGSSLVEGRGVGIVISTGDKCIMAQILGMASGGNMVRDCGVWLR
jgi:sodium/potassium-transporting ATPase subunit alpha